MECIRSLLGGLGTEESSCEVTRFTTLVTAGYCHFFSIVSTENDPQLDNRCHAYLLRDEGGWRLYPMWKQREKSHGWGQLFLLGPIAA